MMGVAALAPSYEGMMMGVAALAPSYEGMMMGVAALAPSYESMMMGVAALAPSFYEKSALIRQRLHPRLDGFVQSDTDGGGLR